jgi:hypothetical protein
MFYACGLHVLCIVPILIIHLQSEKHDIGGGNHGYARWNVHLVKSFFYVVTKLIFIHPATNLYATSAQITFLRILTIVSIHPISHHVP